MSITSNTNCLLIKNLFLTSKAMLIKVIEIASLAPCLKAFSTKGINNNGVICELKSSTSQSKLIFNTIYLIGSSERLLEGV